jgi:elongation factor G
MSQLPMEKKRNIVLIGHPGSGKTALLEAILYYLGSIPRMGKTEDGNTFSDYTDEEKSRQTSIYTTLARIEHDGCGINIFDAPGFPDFLGEIQAAIRVADAAIAVVNASAGLEVELEKCLKLADRYDVPVMLFVNKMDKERADYAKAISQAEQVLGLNCIPITMPIGSEAGFSGVVDLREMKALTFDNKGKVKSAGDIPDELSSQAEEYREKLLDAAAEQDEAVMEKYLEGEALTPQELAEGLRLSVAERSAVPVFCGNASECVSIPPLLDAIAHYAPSPQRRAKIEAVKGGSEEKVTLDGKEDASFAAFVFRTSIDPFSGKLSFFRVYSGTLTPDQGVYNVGRRKHEKVAHILEVNGKSHKQVSKATPGDICALAKLDSTLTGDTLAAAGNDILIPPTEYPQPTIQMALVSESRQDEEKLGSVIGRITEADPTLNIIRNTETREMVISGMGEQHLEVALEKMKNLFQLNVGLRLPKVAYRETITTQGEGSYRHKKQSGGHGQFGEVHLRLKPLPRGEGFNFVDSIVGGVIPNKFIPSVEKGVRERMQRGILAGYPVQDIEVELFYGKDHPVDSSDIAFKIAGSMGFRKVAQDCKPILLEPIMNLEVTVPEDVMGDVISDLNSKRGRIMGMDPQDGSQVIRAQVPLGEMFRYSVDLRSISRSRGSFTMEFSHYDPVPKELADKVIAASKQEKEEA